MKRLAKKDRGAFLLTCVLNIYSGCVLDCLFLILRKGPQTQSDTKPEKYYADCSCCFLYSYSTSYLVGTEKLHFWVTALVQSPLWQWLVLDTSRCRVRRSSTFPVLQAEQHLQCLLRTDRVWVGLLIPLQSLPTLGKIFREHGPAFLSMESSSIPISLSFKISEFLCLLKQFPKLWKHFWCISIKNQAQSRQTFFLKSFKGSFCFINVSRCLEQVSLCV